MSKPKSTRQQLLDECETLTTSLYGVTYKEYTARRHSLPDLPHNRAKIRLDMYDRILSDGWLHED